MQCIVSQFSWLAAKYANVKEVFFVDLPDGLTTHGNYEIGDQVNFAVYIPKVDEHFVGSLALIPLQLMGYYVSSHKNLLSSI